MNSSIPYLTKRGLRKKRWKQFVFVVKQLLKWFRERTTSPLLSVVLMAKVWFKVGLFHAVLEHQDAQIVAG